MADNYFGASSVKKRKQHFSEESNYINPETGMISGDSGPAWKPNPLPPGPIKIKSGQAGAATSVRQPVQTYGNAASSPLYYPPATPMSMPGRANAALSGFFGANVGALGGASIRKALTDESMGQDIWQRQRISQLNDDALRRQLMMDQIAHSGQMRAAEILRSLPPNFLTSPEGKAVVAQLSRQLTDGIGGPGAGASAGSSTGLSVPGGTNTATTPTQPKGRGPVAAFAENVAPGLASMIPFMVGGPTGALANGIRLALSPILGWAAHKGMEMLDPKFNDTRAENPKASLGGTVLGLGIGGYGTRQIRSPGTAGQTPIEETPPAQNTIAPVNLSPTPNASLPPTTPGAGVGGPGVGVGGYGAAASALRPPSMPYGAPTPMEPPTPPSAPPLATQPTGVSAPFIQPQMTQQSGAASIGGIGGGAVPPPISTTGATGRALRGETAPWETGGSLPAEGIERNVHYPNEQIEYSPMETAGGVTPEQLEQQLFRPNVPFFQMTPEQAQRVLQGVQPQLQPPALPQAVPPAAMRHRLQVKSRTPMQP